MIKKAAIASTKAVKNNLSFSLTVVSFLLISGAGVLQIFDKVKTAGPFMELFMTCAGLYLGRSYVKSKEPKVEEDNKEEL